MSLWDDWRKNYDTTSYQDELNFYNRMSPLYPNQHFYNASAAKDFLFGAHPNCVFELGGWRGEMAAEMTKYLPWLERWENFEISEWAVQNTVSMPARPPYIARVPEQWIWDYPRSAFDGFDCAVFAHVTEHMRIGEFEKLISKMDDCHDVFINSPLGHEPTDWTGYDGSHIIEVGWDGLVKMMARYNYGPVDWNIDADDVNSRYMVFDR